MIQLTSSKQLPEISLITITAWCSYPIQSTQPNQPITHHTFECFPSLISEDGSKNNQFGVYYVLKQTENLTKNVWPRITDVYFTARVQFNDYILLYPIDLSLSFSWFFFLKGNVLAPVETTVIPRYYFESFHNLFWFSPCGSVECTYTSGIWLSLEGWTPPPKDDEDGGEASQSKYTLRLQLSHFSYFSLDDSSMTQIDTTCSLNYLSVRLFSVEDEGVKPTAVYLSLEDSELPLFGLSTLYFHCRHLRVNFHHIPLQNYYLTVESGVLYPTTGKFKPLSTYTDVWSYKRYIPRSDISFSPGGYATDGSTSVRGFMRTTKGTIPTARDRIIFCGIEEASVVTFTVHQRITNELGQKVWKSHAPFDNGETSTSKSYADPFDPAWGDMDYSFDEMHNSGDGGHNNIRTTEQDGNDGNDGNNANNANFDKKDKYLRYLNARKVLFEGKNFTDLGQISQNLVTQVEKFWSKKLNIFEPELNYRSKHNQIHEYNSEMVFQHQNDGSFKMTQNNPVQNNPNQFFPQNYQTSTFRALSTPVEDRICIRLHPFKSVEKLRPGLFWFVGFYKLADQGERFTLSSNPTERIESPKNKSLETLSTHEEAGFSTLGDISRLAFLDLFYHLSGSHVSAGVGLYNWRYSGTISLPKGKTIWLGDKGPSYIPQPQLKAQIRNLQQEIKNNKDSGNLSLQTALDHQLTNLNLDLSLYDLYPYHARFPDLYVKIATSTPYVNQKTTALAINSYGYQVLFPRSILLNPDLPNYFEYPEQYAVLFPVDLNCVVKHGKYVDDETHQMTEIPITSISYQITTLLINLESTLIIDTENEYDGIYLSCPGLVLISEGPEMFSKRTSVALHLYESIDPVPIKNPLTQSSYITFAYENPVIMNHEAITATANLKWKRSIWEKIFTQRTRLPILISTLAVLLIIIILASGICLRCKRWYQDLRGYDIDDDDDDGELNELNDYHYNNANQYLEDDELDSLHQSTLNYTTAQIHQPGYHPPPPTPIPPGTIKGTPGGVIHAGSHPGSAMSRLGPDGIAGLIGLGSKQTDPEIDPMQVETQASNSKNTLQSQANRFSVGNGMMGNKFTQTTTGSYNAPPPMLYDGARSSRQPITDGHLIDATVNISDHYGSPSKAGGKGDENQNKNGYNAQNYKSLANSTASAPGINRLGLTPTPSLSASSATTGAKSTRGGPARGQVQGGKKVKSNYGDFF
jgi:hypothetical protein